MQGASGFKPGTSSQTNPVDVQRLKEELAMNQMKLAKWEEGIQQARFVSILSCFGRTFFVFCLFFSKAEIMSEDVKILWKRIRSGTDETSDDQVFCNLYFTFLLLLCYYRMFYSYHNNVISGISCLQMFSTLAAFSYFVVWFCLIPVFKNICNLCCLSHSSLLCSFSQLIGYLCEYHGRI